MKLRYIVVPLVLVAAGVGIWRVREWKNQPPELTFTKVVRETIANTISTNGKVEPVEFATARAERAGAVRKISVQLRQVVGAGDVLVELDDSEAETDLAAAQARIAQVRSDLDVLSAGGRASERNQIDSDMAQTKLDREIAQREYDRAKRLQEKQAGTLLEVSNAKETLDRLDLKIKSLGDKKATLVSGPDRAAVEARLHEAEAAAQQAQTRIKMSLVRAPLAGTVYQFDLKPGAYLSAGDIVASIGRLDRVHVNVFVDEPDLGRVASGMPVTITWDAMPGRQWKGAVDRTATQIVPLGSRQVGEVVCLISNPDRDLLPGTNVNAVIRSNVVENAITIPKETVYRQLGQAGVYVLNGDRIQWRTITQGVENTTRTQVNELKEGDAVALPSDRPLVDGMLVRAVLQ